MAEETKSVEPNDKDQHPDYPGLTWGEVRAAQRRAEDKMAKRAKAEMLARIEEQHEKQVAPETADQWLVRVTENLPPSLRQMCSITLSLPPQMPDIRIDGRVFPDRGTYNVPLAVAREMMKIQYDGWASESVRKGDDKYAFYAQQRMANAPKLVINTAGSILSGTAPRGTH